MKSKGKKRIPSRKTSGKRIGSLRAMAETPEWTEEMRKLYKPIKKPVTLRLDADVLAWFRRQGRGYQTRINRALREVMMKGK